MRIKLDNYEALYYEKHSRSTCFLLTPNLNAVFNYYQTEVADNNCGSNNATSPKLIDIYFGTEKFFIRAPFRHYEAPVSTDQQKQGGL